VQRRPTSTSNFGSGKRESHDASGFYARFADERLDLSDDATVLAPREIVDPIRTGDARDMRELRDGEVALVVTSPPYFAGKQYEEEATREGVPASYTEYLTMLREVFDECVRVLEPGGRIAVNVANLGRKPYRNLAADVTAILASLGLLLRGEIVWQKADGATGSCAWGSFRSPANPVLRDMTERIVVASKGRFDRALKAPVRKEQDLPHRITIGADEFMESTLDVWHFASESAKRVGHPAPFPVALPERLIHMHTYENDLILDPFLGSGSTLVAAARTGRRYVGYDLDPAYCELAKARVAEELAELASPKLISWTNSPTARSTHANTVQVGETVANPATDNPTAENPTADNPTADNPQPVNSNPDSPTPNYPTKSYPTPTYPPGDSPPPVNPAQESVEHGISAEILITSPAKDSTTAQIDPVETARKKAQALVGQFVDEGLSTNEMAKRVLQAAGFTMEKSDVRIPDTGMIVPFVVRDATGKQWHIDLCGTNIASRGGLNRLDTTWRAIARGSILEGVGTKRLLMLTPKMARPKSEQDRLIRGWLSTGQRAQTEHQDLAKATKSETSYVESALRSAAMYAARAEPCDWRLVLPQEKATPPQTWRIASVTNLACRPLPLGKGWITTNR
jgi:DNA modification methylase